MAAESVSGRSGAGSVRSRLGAAIFERVAGPEGGGTGIRATPARAGSAAQERTGLNGQ